MSQPDPAGFVPQQTHCHQGPGEFAHQDPQSGKKERILMVFLPVSYQYLNKYEGNDVIFQQYLQYCTFFLSLLIQ